MSILKHSKTIEGRAKHDDELDKADADPEGDLELLGCFL